MPTEGIIGQRNTVPSRGFDQGEHGAGIGAAGGYDESNPKATPIADKYMGGGDSYGALGTGRAPIDIDQDTAGTRQAPLGAAVGLGSLGHGQSQAGTGGSAVSGAYEGSGTRDGLTGEAHSHRVGAGAGYLGENFPQPGSTGTTTSAALAGTAAGATAGAGLAATRSQGADGSIAGPAGGAGGHYTTTTSSSATQQGVAAGAGAGAGLTGQSNVIGDEYSKRSVAGGEYGHNPAVATTTGGNGPLGAGAAAGGLGAAGTAGAVGQTDSGAASSGATTGHFGTVDDHNRGGEPYPQDRLQPLSHETPLMEAKEPVSDPKELDTGGPHSLVYQESTGKYVHRHDLEGSR
ncbi:hypothetical protein EHS25_008462 [Saitozyma podzolica]|uniref:Uncharacterized protein n=1 Tax=Saitozyma podzolica TaxID=1890683 RepID=A0A427YPH1_9TREE|nr:hypothetical protein EHS25_008462 [Saitozyma podzolica]